MIGEAYAFLMIRYEFVGKGKRSHTMATRSGNAAANTARLGTSPLASSALAESCNSSRANFYKEVGIDLL